MNRVRFDAATFRVQAGATVSSLGSSSRDETIPIARTSPRTTTFVLPGPQAGDGATRTSASTCSARVARPDVAAAQSARARRHDICQTPSICTPASSLHRGSDAQRECQRHAVWSLMLRHDPHATAQGVDDLAPGAGLGQRTNGASQLLDLAGQHRDRKINVCRAFATAEAALAHDCHASLLPDLLGRYQPLSRGAE